MAAIIHKRLVVPAPDDQADSACRFHAKLWVRKLLHANCYSFDN